jgi:hypothetical protein
MNLLLCLMEVMGWYRVRTLYPWKIVSAAAGKRRA